MPTVCARGARPLRDTAPMESTPAPPTPVTEQQGNAAVWITGILALFAWAIAAWSCVDQKRTVDKQIASVLDISAVQIQQLNGSLTAHILVALAIALALTIPLLLSVAVTITSK